MKQLFVGVMLVITAATSVSANPLDGLGAERAVLTPAQIADRSARLEESTTFALLRFPEALRAPSRILSRDIWSAITSAAGTYDLDPMVLAGMIFIESYGDPLAKSPTGPAGIAQLTRASAREMGLSTGRRVRVGTKAVKKTRWVGKGKSRRRVTQTVRQAVYKTVDDRYVPERAIAAMARRVSTRRSWLGGKVDFAIAEYHMGAGRMAKLLSAYFGRTIRVSDVPDVMASADVTYSGLFWTNTPYHRPAVYQALDRLNRVDYSPTYYFRVRQAMRLLSLYRESPAAYAELASGFQNRFGHTVLPNMQWTFVTQEDISVAPVSSSGELASDVSERFVELPDLASTFGLRTPGPVTAERSTIGSALLIADQLRSLQGKAYRGLAIGRMRADGNEEDQALPLHGLGWAFDIPSTGLTKTEIRDLRFVLTDLRHAGLLTYAEDGRQPTFHIVRHPDHTAAFEQVYWDAMGGPPPGDTPSVVIAAAGGRDNE